MYVHRFIKVSDHVMQNGGDGKWMGRLKTMTVKQDQIQDDIKDLKELIIAN